MHPTIVWHPGRVSVYNATPERNPTRKRGTYSLGDEETSSLPCTKLLESGWDPGKVLD